MTPLLTQFLLEGREVLQAIAETLMELEQHPDDAELMSSLFRSVHTLKGNSGLFDFPEMTRLLHAAEDLMDSVRSGATPFSKLLADKLLEAMDVVAELCDEIEASDGLSPAHNEKVAPLATALRALVSEATPSSSKAAEVPSDQARVDPRRIALIPSDLKVEIVERLKRDEQIMLVSYVPETDCFFRGEDPFLVARSSPGLLFGVIEKPMQWPALPELDAFQCVISFIMALAAPRDSIEEHFRYMREQVELWDLSLADFLTAPAKAPDEQLSSLAREIAAAQREALNTPVEPGCFVGRVRSVAATWRGCLASAGVPDQASSLELALAEAERRESSEPMLRWYEATFRADERQNVAVDPEPVRNAAEPEAKSSVKEGSALASKTLRVDQAKVDRLMGLIGEMAVSKNALPYLAGRAESVYGQRELAREIKAQYGTIHRIVEEMQDCIMQVRMMPLSFVFQRFPRLVRDISRKIGKEVRLEMLGEETQADKTIVEALIDPLMHIVRNALDHGLETAEERREHGKPPCGTLSLRATQEADRVVIEIADDGRGIDPEIVKQKAYRKGLLTEAELEKIGPEEARRLVFAPGFSTADVVSELSGRGVGMDAVKTAVERLRGSISLSSETGKGTVVRLSLPLSMAVTSVMRVEADGQDFGIAMESVVETVRVRSSSVLRVKDNLVTVLRGKIIPLRSLHDALALSSTPRVNTDDEFAVLVVRLGDESVGLMVDSFRETNEVLVKPVGGVLAELPIYSGSALLGDGSVLLVLDVREMF